MAGNRRRGVVLQDRDRHLLIRTWAYANHRSRDDQDYGRLRFKDTSESPFDC